MNRIIQVFIIFIIISAISKPLLGQKTKQIVIVHSDIISVNEISMPNLQILKGSVILKHDSALMFCDSAYFNSLEMNFKAFGKIHVQSPTEDLQDTVELWGDSLNYSGKEKLARVRNHVILKNDSMTLYTDNLDYNISEDIGKYVDGGRTITSKDTLVSQQGYYFANENEIFLKEKVQVFNPKYTIYSDTLKYNTKKNISYMLGPTNIVSTDTTSSFIYCENGWYNANKDIAQFNKNAILVNGKQTLKGDSLYYDRKQRIGRAFNNVTATDSAQNVLLRGNVGEYHELSERSIMTKDALFIQVQKEDSLFLHADTLLSIKDTLITKTDTTIFTLIKGYHRVKIFKEDFQAKCDSMVYTMLDSTIELHNEPVIWSDKNQITATFIKILTVNNAISKVYMDLNALIVSKSDTINFNQIKGKNMIAFFKNDSLNKIEVKENGALIYFGRENEKLVGVNKLTCKNMTIYWYNNEPDTIWFYENPEGTLYPPNYLTEDELKFEDFQWNEYQRPKSKKDVFIWNIEQKETETKENKKKTENRDKGKAVEKNTQKGNLNNENSKNSNKLLNQKQKTLKK